MHSFLALSWLITLDEVSFSSMRMSKQLYGVEHAATVLSVKNKTHTGYFMDSHTNAIAFEKFAVVIFMDEHS